MAKQLLVFNGGLQTKLQEHLIEPNQATLCSNIDLSKGSIFPYYGLSEYDTATGKYVYFNDGTIIANTDVTDIRSYATFGNRIYWTDGSYSPYGLLRYGGNVGGVEATAPTAPDGTITPTPSGTTGGLNGDYVYAYTYVDLDGIESAPSPYFNLTTTDYQDVALVISAETNAPADISHRKIYRTGGNNPTFNLVCELANPLLTYNDITRDIDISRIELSTFSNGTPNGDLTNLVENSGTMWASVNDRVYFSANGQPEYWNQLDFIQLNDACTGIGKFGDAILAFTKADSYLITGYNRDTVASKLLPYREGCTSHETIANVGDYLLWASYSGICIFNGSSVDIMTKNILSWNKESAIGDTRFGDYDENTTFESGTGFKINKALGIDGHYYGIFQGGILDIDVLNKQTASTIYIEDTVSLFYNDMDDTIGIISGIESPYSVYKFNTDTDTTMNGSWTTGHIQDEGYAIKKHYRKVELDNVPTKVTVKVSDTKQFTIEGKKDFFLPSGFIGNYIQLEIETTTEIKSVQYQYGILK